jgi:hypothetical protein
MAKRKRKLCGWPCCPEIRTNLGQPGYVSVQLGRFPRITVSARSSPPRSFSLAGRGRISSACGTLPSRAG